MSSLFRRKLDELEDMFIASQDDLLARFSATYEENKRLKAEVERLTQLQTETLNERNKAEAEVERLTKAGDAMVPLLGRGDWHIARNDWNAAKEGHSR